jgi:hypothetical protein
MAHGERDSVCTNSTAEPERWSRSQQRTECRRSKRVDSDLNLFGEIQEEIFRRAPLKVNAQTIEPVVDVFELLVGVFGFGVSFQAVHHLIAHSELKLEAKVDAQQHRQRVILNKRRKSVVLKCVDSIFRDFAARHRIRDRRESNCGKKSRRNFSTAREYDPTSSDENLLRSSELFLQSFGFAV